MRRIVQPAVIKVIQKQVVEYTCDRCGEVCGTKANPKETWYGAGATAGKTSHYCKRTCSPADQP